MVKIRGLCLHDTYLFKEVIKKKTQKSEQKFFNFKKHLVVGKNFYKRRSGLIKVLNKISNINKVIQSNLKKATFFSKLYNNMGLYTVLSRFFLFFKILKKKNNYLFLKKKLRSFFYETLKTSRKKFLTVVIERIDLIDKSFVKILKNFFKTNETKILWIFTGNNLKKIKIIRKNFPFRILNGDFFQNRINLSCREYSKYTLEKNYFIVNKKFHITTGDVFLFFKNISFDFLKKLRVRSEYQIFFNFIFFKLFSFTKKFNPEVFIKFFQFSAHMDYENFFSNKFIYFKLKRKFKKDFKKKMKSIYIELMLIILINSMK